VIGAKGRCRRVPRLRTTSVGPIARDLNFGHCGRRSRPCFWKPRGSTSIRIHRKESPTRYSRPDRIDTAFVDRLLSEVQPITSACLLPPQTLDRIYEFRRRIFRWPYTTPCARPCPARCSTCRISGPAGTRRALVGADDILIVAGPESRQICANAKKSARPLARCPSQRPPPPPTVLNQVGIPKRPENQASGFLPRHSRDAPVATIAFEAAGFSAPLPNNGADDCRGVLIAPRPPIRSVLLAQLAYRAGGSKEKANRDFFSPFHWQADEAVGLIDAGELITVFGKRSSPGRPANGATGASSSCRASGGCFLPRQAQCSRRNRNGRAPAR